jgi:hypothetical protein
MQGTYATEDEAMAAIAGLANVYRQNYADVYGKRAGEIEDAIEVLQSLYRSSHFPEYEVDARTYPDNIGHDEFPGCFRCHDGKHLARDGSSIRLHCNICHTIPLTVGADEPAPAIPFQPFIPQPDSHLASNWMAEHRTVADLTCTGCHEVQTFCANPNCHGRSWPYVDLKVVNPPFPLPGPTAVPTEPPPQTPTLSPALPADMQRGAALYSRDCAACHPQAGRLETDDLREAVLEGVEGMPAFPYSDAQVGDLQAFVTWSAQNPGQAPATATSAPVSTAVPEATPSFSTEILPTLQSKCGTSCHSAANASGGFRAVDYTAVSAAVTPGSPDASRLVVVQRGQHAANLTAAELELVVAWIKAGAPHN